MESKIQLISRRILELQDLIAAGRGDVRSLTKMLHVNEKILARLYAGEDIRFYKIPQVNPTPDFFLSTAQRLEPFISIMN